MQPKRRQKLTRYLGALCVLAAVVALTLYALRQNISLFYTPFEVAQNQAPVNVPIRIGGMVEVGSVVHGKGVDVRFHLTDYKASVTVHYSGLLPDLFRENQGLVVEGKLMPDNTIQASRVLAKHDESYMPPEVKAALESVPS